MELRAYAARVLDAVRPRDHKWIARSAQVRSHLLAPLEGSIHGPRPADGNVVGGLGAAELVDVLEQELRAFRHTLKRGELVERPAQSPFHRSAVVADLPDDGRFFQLADLLESGQPAPDLMVGLRGIGGKDLH